MICLACHGEMVYLGEEVEDGHRVWIFWCEWCDQEQSQLPARTYPQVVRAFKAGGRDAATAGALLSNRKSEGKNNA